MTYSLLITEEALTEERLAYEYYEERKTGLGVRFLEEIRLKSRLLQPLRKRMDISTVLKK